jgi:hypothetical protein
MLERIEKAFLTKKECEGPKASATGGGSSKKRMVAFSCALCKQHGGAHNTHNTGECHKYEKDRTPKKAFAGKSVQRNLHNRNALREHNTSNVCCPRRSQSLKNITRNLKSVNKKRKRNCDSDREDSDLS